MKSLSWGQLILLILLALAYVTQILPWAWNTLLMHLVHQQLLLTTS